MCKQSRKTSNKTWCTWHSSGVWITNSLDHMWCEHDNYGYTSCIHSFSAWQCGSVSTAVPVPRVTHLYFIFFHRKENNNIFLDDLKEDGEKRPFPNPCRTFLEAFDHYPEIMENIERVGFLKPTPIQVWAWCLSNFILYFIINYTVSYYCRI